MYMLRVEPLCTAFREGDKPNDRQLLPYLVGHAVVLSLVAWLPLSGLMATTWLGPSLVSVVVAAIGIWFVYRANGGRDGTQLLPKLLMLGWIASVRTVALAIVVEFALAEAIRELPSNPNPAAFGTLYTYLPVLYLFLWYSQMERYVRRTRVDTSETNAHDVSTAFPRLSPFDV